MNVGAVISLAFITELAGLPPLLSVCYIRHVCTYNVTEEKVERMNCVSSSAQLILLVGLL